MHKNQFHLSLFVKIVPCPWCFLILNQVTLAFTMRLDPVVFEHLGHGYINKTPKEVFVVIRFANGRLFSNQTKTNLLNTSDHVLILVQKSDHSLVLIQKICSNLLELLVMVD